MARFVQPQPEPTDPYTTDHLLQSWLQRHLQPTNHHSAHTRLTALATDITHTLRAAHHDAENNPPTLTRYDPWGMRIDRINTSHGWQTQRAAAAHHAIVALPYLPEARTEHGTATRTVQHALLHLYGPESATFTCPIAMADGAAALLNHPDVDPTTRDTWLPRLTSTDPDTAITSGQWMTETQGGSDLSHTSTIATEQPDGTWRLHGHKWFCSAADSAIAVALARPDSAGPGSRVLAPFLVPRYAADSPLTPPGTNPHHPAPGLTIHRLKDKLGTRAVPTGEISLDGAHATPLGDPHQPGLARTMVLVVITRLHNAAAAAAGMRRSLTHALAYARTRRIATGTLADNPLHRATLGTLAVDTAGAFTLAAHAFALLGRVEVSNDPDAETELRLVAPLAKLATARLAVAAASEHLESFGGAGYIEDTGIPRLLRDAQVLPIWEGTTNVLAIDTLRAITRDDAAKPLLTRLANAADTARTLSPALADTLTTTQHTLHEHLTAARADPQAPTTLAGARGLALRMAHALTTALLVEHAAWGHEPTTITAQLWARRWLHGHDISTDAHHHLDTIS